MPAGTLALLASALLHAGWNALLKRERAPETAVLGVLAVALATAVLAAAALPGTALPPPASLGWSAAAGLFEGAYLVTLAAALGRASYGAVYALASLREPGQLRELAARVSQVAERHQG